MNSVLLAVVSILYFIVGINYMKSSDYGLSIAFVAYAIANVGLYLQGIK